MTAPTCVRVPTMPHGPDENRNPARNFHAGTAFTALPRTIRRRELRLIVPLADSTIYEMEKRGEFPRHFNLTSRCVVWDLEEVETWLWERRQACATNGARAARGPDVRLRKTRPVKAVRE